MPTISFVQGEDGYAGVLDTVVRERRPGTSYGDAAVVDTDGADHNRSGKEAQGLLQFADLIGPDAGQIPVGAHITSATLSLRTTNVGDGAALHRMVTPWSEDSTWTSLGGGIQADGTEAVLSPDLVTGTVTARGRSDSTFDVTASVQAWTNGADNFGWAFLPSGANGWDFRSSEHGSSPILTVAYSVLPGSPEPLPPKAPKPPPPKAPEPLPPDNTAPVAANDTASTNEGTPVRISVLNNDTDPNSDPLTVSGIIDPVNGTAVINTDGTITYTPPANFVGTGTFGYTLNDNQGGTDTATVTIGVIASPPPPISPPPPPSTTPFKGSVFATVETPSLPGTSHHGDVADDPAIWINRADPSRSAVIGTDKDPTKGGLYVFDLQGRIVDTAGTGQAMNNVDLRYGFDLGGSPVDLIGASNREDSTLDFFTINAATRELNPVGSVATGLSSIYGFAMHRSPNGEYYAFVSTGEGTSRGDVKQFELDGSTGSVTGEGVRTLKVGSGDVEGMVVDDQTGDLYIAEEKVGIWKYDVDPATGSTRTAVDKVGGGHLTADVEGLTLYYGANGTGYLIASSQGSSTYAVYDRAGNNAYRGSFSVTAGNGIDGTSDTDGLDVTNMPLGSSFPTGMLVVHDNSNTSGSTSNFKLVPWDDVAALGGLITSTAPNPQIDWLL